MSPVEELKTEYILTGYRVCRMILRHRLPGNRHTDGVPPRAPANASWKSCHLMASVKAVSTSEYVSSEMIGLGVFANMIGSMNSYATLKVAFWCGGTLLSPPAFSSGTFQFPPAVGSGTTCTESD
jgi:hypothetical protein